MGAAFGVESPGKLATARQATRNWGGHRWPAPVPMGGLHPALGALRIDPP